ncbi:MAG: hypothetical protein NC397_07305 [Clostridium sp.]|nr:hypothetical protein [Clostridium sp.]
MIRILFIDDSIERLQELTKMLVENGIDHISDYVCTKEDALKKLSSVQYDMVLLDIMLPDNMKKQGISEQAGLEILKAIEIDNGIIKPLYVMGITSSEETYKKSIDQFNKSLIPLSIWKKEDSWKMQFISKVKYLIKLSTSYTPINKFKVDVALITAVTDEYIALDNLPVEWENISINDDPAAYSIGEIIDDCGKPRKILKTKLLEMGMSAASYSTTKIIDLFDPDLVIMVGICGGRKGDVDLGDIIVADRAWDYGSGKINIDDNGEMYFSAQPNQINIDTRLKAIIDKNKDIIDEIYMCWNKQKHEKKTSNVHIGALPSGSAVVAAKSFTDSIIAPQYRKFLGIDMETYGVYFAGENAKSNVRFVSIKAVSDMADKDKKDDYHEYSSYISSAFAFELIKKGILFSD